MLNIFKSSNKKKNAKKQSKNKKISLKGKKNFIRSKLSRMTRGFPKSYNLKSLERALSTPSIMQKTFLNPDFLYNSLLELLPTDCQSEEESDDETDFKFTEIKKKVRNKKNIQLPVKFIVTEIISRKNYKTIRKLVSPVIKKIPRFKKEFGLFHTALIIGPWYLEWTNSSVVIPRKLYSSMAIISSDIDTNQLLKSNSFEDISYIIAKIACKWNNKKTYTNMNSKDKNFGNCQEFVEDVMKELKLTLPMEGSFGTFLKKMKEKGQCEIEFVPCEKFKQKFNLKLKKYKFDTHNELDSFIYMLQKINDISFNIDYPEDFKLLKSFDRAFWLRHIKKPKIEIFKPSYRGCPFEDPRLTKSYMTFS